MARSQDYNAFSVIFHANQPLYVPIEGNSASVYTDLIEHRQSMPSMGKERKRYSFYMFLVS